MWLHLVILSGQRIFGKRGWHDFDILNVKRKYLDVVDLDSEILEMTKFERLNQSKELQKTKVFFIDLDLDSHLKSSGIESKIPELEKSSRRTSRSFGHLF